uniref:Dynein regulatory complex subunit 7 n=1 Tax=Amphilophus citrinellus TaxID=61819 RepID=A0A3Q0RCJ8_AMPCI
MIFGHNVCASDNANNNAKMLQIIEVCERVRAGVQLKVDTCVDGYEIVVSLHLLSFFSPKSYRSNSPEEIRLLAMADSFQRQYSHLCPDRTPLLLCPVNECGVKKFVSTSLRPTSTVHCELFSWQGCASFVADSLSLVPLDPPPKHLFSPTAVLQSQRATCFEYATLLCSLLLGENYDAYCVSGYAVKEMCVLDQSLQECPLLDTEVKVIACISVCTCGPPSHRLLSHMLNPHHINERGLRVHCWVLVLSGSRSIQENFFIDPLTGISYPTNSDKFLGIESVWNNLNYYVNMQDCSNGCADMMFDLDDLKTWEPLLFGAPSKKQLIQKVLKRKDLKLMGKRSNLEDEPNVFEMPRSWVRYIAISHEAMENRFPGGEKVIRYKQAQLERFARRRRSHGLVTRLTKYKDRDCECHMFLSSCRSRAGSSVCLLCSVFRVKHLTVDTEVEMHFSSAHADGVVQRVLSKTEMMELFEGRRDFLCYRHVCFREHIQEFYERPEELHILKVVERFHRNSSKPASEDVAERAFLEPERLIEVTYHLTKDQSVPSKISFIKPLESEKGKAQEFSLDMISTFQVHVANMQIQISQLILESFCSASETRVQKQEWFQVTQHELSKQEKEEYQQHCAHKRIQIKAARERLHMYSRAHTHTHTHTHSSTQKSFPA